MAGEIDGRKFVAKLRERRLDKGDTQMSDEKWSKIFLPSRRIVYAEESILNEMKLSPHIKAALSMDEVQEKVQKLGFNSVSFTEPIMGVVSRSPNPDLPYSREFKRDWLAWS